MPYYVGVGTKTRVFQSSQHPCVQSHGDLYTNIIGPFKSLLGADYYAKYGKGDPNCSTFKEAEQLGYAYALVHAQKAMTAIDEYYKPALRYLQFYFCNKCKRQLKRADPDKKRGTKRRCPNYKCAKVYYEKVWCKTCKRWTQVILGSGNELRCMNCTMVIR
jgi:hypothetical protein